MYLMLETTNKLNKIKKTKLILSYVMIELVTNKIMINILPAFESGFLFVEMFRFEVIPTQNILVHSISQ